MTEIQPPLPFLNWVTKDQEDVILQNNGKSQVVLIPFTDYELLLEARKIQKERAEKERKALFYLEQLRLAAEENSKVNQDLSDEEVDELVEEITSEAIGSLVERGAVRFVNS
ncbi:MAG: hypothetical protein AAF639_45220 [Chloroflexota bacterium]